MSASGRQRSYVLRLPLVTLFVLMPFLPQCDCGANTTTPLSTTPSTTAMTSSVMAAPTQTSTPSASTGGLPASPSVTIPTTPPPPTSDTKFAIELVNKEWSDTLSNKNSKEFKALSAEVSIAVNKTLFDRNIRAVSVVVERFRRGSVIADINVTTTDPKSNVKEELEAAMASGNIGSLEVNPLVLLGKAFGIPITLKYASAASSDDLRRSISSLLNKTSQLVALHINITGKKARVTAVFNDCVSLYTKNTLSPLLEQVETGRLGNQSVTTPVTPYIKYPALTSKDFEIGYITEQVCTDIKIPVAHYASSRIANSLKDNSKDGKVLELLDATCNANLLKANATVALKLNADDNPQSSFSPLYCEANTNDPTITATLLTPTTPDPTPEITVRCTPRPTTNTRPPTEPSTTKPVTQGPDGPLKTPKLFVRLKFEMTWREFCATQDSLKQKIAANLFDKDGKTVSQSRIKFINRDKNCADPSKQNERPVDLWWYASDKNQQNPDKCLTMKAMKVMRSLLENGNTKVLGPLFSGKVISVELAGCAAPKGIKPLDNVTLILILAGAILGALILLLACCCLCCGGRRRRRRRKYYEKSDGEVFVVMNGDGTASNKARNRKKRRGKAGASDGEVELKRKGNRGKGERNGNIDGHGATAGHHGRRRGLDDDDDDDYTDVCDDGCCGGGGGRGGGGGGDLGGGSGQGADGGRRGGKGKGKGKGKDGRKMRKHENGKEGSMGNKRGKDDEDGKINQGMENDDDASKTDKGEGRSEEHDFKRPDSQDQVYAETSKPSAHGGLAESNQNSGSEIPIGAAAGGLAAGVLIAGAAASRGSSHGSPRTSPRASPRGSPRESPVSSKRLSLTPLNSAGNSDTNRGPGANGQSPQGSPTGNRGSPSGSRRGSANLSPERGYDSPSGNRRGSANLSPDRGSFSMVRSPTPAVLRHVDDKADFSRRRSSAFGLTDDGSSPLMHKTATVGIVALALRNKNERKKEAEFKNLDPDMPSAGHYPPDTAIKNRNPDILPSPYTNIKLSKNPDYINANFVRDHKGQKRYIVTQHPLRDTITDFWQMIWDQQITLVVMVNDEEHLQPADYLPYWAASEGESKRYGPFDVTAKHVDKQPDYVKTVLSLSDTVSRKAEPPLEVTHMRFTSWKQRDRMPNVGLFVTFLTAVRMISKKQEETNPTKPVLVHCSDGQGYSGVYVAVDIGIRSHEESSNSVVDVFEMAKKLRRDRQGIICSLEHFNFTYQSLYEYTVNIQS